MIPEASVEAAGQALRDAFDWGVTDFDKQARAALEAAAPYMLAALADEADRDSKADPGYPYAPSAAAAAHRWLRVKADGS